MALHWYFLSAQCVVLHINAEVAFNETTAQWIPNHNMRDNGGEVYDFITTFFDLLWYIIGLSVLCVCSISCVLLFYIQQRRQQDPKPKRRISESTCNTTTTHSSNITITRKTISCTPSPVISVTSITKSPSKSPQIHRSLPTATQSKNHDHTYSNYSLSAFSGVDSEGIDLDDNHTFSEYNHNVFKSLAPISENINCSPSISSCNRFKRNYDDDETFDGDTDDMQSVELMNNEHNHDQEESAMSSDSSESDHPFTIIAMMKKRAQKSPIAYHKNREQRNSAKYKRRYAQTDESSTELEHDTCIV